MTDRVTREQAEAALRRIDAMSQDLDELGEEHVDVRIYRLCRSKAGEIEVVRAYIAQRPDEETIRKGWEAITGLQAEFAPSDNPFGELTLGQIRDLLSAIRAALYPKEEA